METKSLSEFPQTRSNRSQLQDQCRICRKRQVRREWEERNAHTKAEWRVKYNANRRAQTAERRRNTPPPTTRVCTLCEIEKPLEDFGVSKKVKRDGRTSRCKECERKRNRERSQTAEYKEYTRRYYQDNQEVIKARAKKWYYDNPDRVRETRQEWQRANRDSINAKAREERRLNGDKMRAREERYREQNPERIRAIKRKWKKNNPDADRNYRERRRMRLYGSDAPAQKIDRNKVIERDNAICHLCWMPCELEDIHLDHIVPVAKGGSHTYNNIAVSHSWCNQRKADKIVESGAYAE